MKKIFIALSMALGLAGCGLMQQQRDNEQRQRLDAALEASQAACTNRLATDPALDPLRKHVNFGKGSQATVEMLASKQKPTKLEQGAILEWDQIAFECVQSDLSAARQYNGSQEFMALVETHYQRQKALRVQLWSREISYGEYLKRSQDNIQKAKSEYRSIIQRQQEVAYNRQMQAAQLQAQQDQAAAQRQAAAAQTMMLFNQAQQQQRQQFNAPGTATNPVQTNCTRMGNSVNCQTYSY